MQSDSPISGQAIASPAGLGPGAGPLPLFHAAWLFAVGIVLAHWLWLRPSLVLVALGLLAVLCGVAALRAQRIAWLPLAVLWLLLGAWCTWMEPQPAPAPALAALSDHLLRTVEGTVVDAGPVRGEIEQNLDEPDAIQNPAQRPSQRIDLRVSSLEVVTDAEDTQMPVEGGVRLTVHWPQVPPAPAGQQPFECGERIRAVVRLLPPEVYHDPGVWSRREFLLDQGITSTAAVGIDRVDRLGRTPGLFFRCRVSGLQHALSARLLALPAAMRRLRLPRVPATLVTILASFVYALFTGFATPVERSLWMVTLYLLGRLLYRERNALNTIGFAALCLLALSPRSLFDASFQMTLLAVVSIGGIAAPLLQNSIHPYLTATRDLRLIALDIKLAPFLAQFRVTLRMIAAGVHTAAGGRFARRIAWFFFPFAVRILIRSLELLAVSCVVELAMALPMAVYFHRITVFALPVNVFILPLLVILMPAALVTLLALAVWPPAAVLPAMIVALPLHFGIWLVRLFGSMAWGDFRIPAPLLWQSLVFCALLGAAIVLSHLSGKNNYAAKVGHPLFGAGLRWPGRAAWAALLLAAVVAVVPRPVDHPRDALLVEAIDVGQGDSLLLITPGGKTLLIDGGGFGGGPHQAPQDYDIGEEVVSEVLWSRGIRRLDAVALTHGHSDHMGGLPAVLRNFRPAEFWVGNNPRFGAYNALLDEAAGLRIRIRSLRAGDAFSFGPTQVNVFAPFRGYQPGAEPTNNDSLVMRVAYGATSVLLEGDAEAPVEQAMLAEQGLQSTLLKVGHHGSITSTRPEFLARVQPQWAVISCGLHNRYGHPRIEVLEELQAARIGTFSTDINGATCFRLDGKTTTPDYACGWRPGR